MPQLNLCFLVLGLLWHLFGHLFDVEHFINHSFARCGEKDCDCELLTASTLKQAFLFYLWMWILIFTNCLQKMFGFLFFSHIKWLIFCVRFLNQYLLNWHHYSCSTFSGILSFCLFFRLFSLSIHESISKNYY